VTLRISVFGGLHTPTGGTPFALGQSTMTQARSVWFESMMLVIGTAGITLGALSVFWP
jgi:hypothetical protein